MADARKHHFDMVLIWGLDRLTREGSAAILNIINTLGLYKVRVLSYQESWTEAPGQLGELLYSIVGWASKMESERRSERTLAGLERAKREGKTLGRPVGSKDTVKRKRTGYLLRYAE
jgi:putative DNA-invertase from lambdoid prophage Rac